MTYKHLEDQSFIICKKMINHLRCSLSLGEYPNMFFLGWELNRNGKEIKIYGAMMMSLPIRHHLH
jgi:hypothetical protein